MNPRRTPPAQSWPHRAVCPGTPADPRESDMRAISLPVLVLDRDARITDANAWAKRKFTIGRRLPEYVVGATMLPSLEACPERSDLAPTTCETLVITDDGRKCAFEWMFFTGQVDAPGFGEGQPDRILAVGRLCGVEQRARIFARAHGLFGRESAILRLLIEGFSNGAIAAQLGLGPRAYRESLRKVFVRLEVRSRVGLLRLLQS